MYPFKFDILTHNTMNGATVHKNTRYAHVKTLPHLIGITCSHVASSFVPVVDILYPVIRPVALPGCHFFADP